MLTKSLAFTHIERRVDCHRYSDSEEVLSLKVYVFKKGSFPVRTGEEFMGHHYS